MRILIYAGYHDPQWNDKTAGLGGTETAIVELARAFPKDTEVTITGDIVPADYGRIQYVHLKALDRQISYDAVIAMSYINFLEELSDVRFEKSYFQFHNTTHYPWWKGEELADGGNYLWQRDRLTGVVCLTEWHKRTIKKAYQGIINKNISVIGDGVVPVLGGFLNYKMDPVRFIYASHPSRGLKEALKIWSSISRRYLNAEFHICCPEYGSKEMQEYTNNDYRITWHGALNKQDYFALLNKCHFWLYPSTYEETCCMVGLDMQMHDVIPITTRHAALGETIQSGFFIEDKSINDITNFIDLLKKSPEIANAIIMKGREFAYTQSWEKKANEWIKLIRSSDGKNP